MRERIMSWMHKISSSFENDEKSPCCWLKAKNTYSSLLQKHSLDCEQHTDCVNTCVNWDGTEVFSYKIPNEKFHMKIAIDRNGNVYVTGKSTNTIQRLYSNGTVDCVVLNEGDGVKIPLSICFNKGCDKLYMTNMNSCVVHVYVCSWRG